MSTLTSAQQKQSRVLACVLCQHRKIKCDRNTPCSNCIKANVTCTPSTPAPARKRRRPNQDLVERLARCEELLKQYAGGPAPSGPPAPKPSDPLTPSTAEDVPEPPSTVSSAFPEDVPPLWKGGGKIVKDEAGGRFMDSYVWATVMDQLAAMKEIVDAEDPDDMAGSNGEPSDKLSPDNNADVLLGADCSNKTITELQPDPVHAFRLWQIFIDRVNPLLKIVHIPTLQPYVLEGAVSMSNIPLNYQALLFAVYLIATLSLTEDESLQILGHPRESMMQRYMQGVKLALVRFDFLRNYDMATLQALLLYLTTFQGRYDRHASWILSGTVVRIAQKMGYHHDGEQLNLPPFETEMRRRIWWQVVALDSKYALVAGLNNSLLPTNWDTKEPSNINDADLFPGQLEPVSSREGPTEMAFVLIMLQMAKFMLKAASNPAFEAAIMGDSLMADDPPNNESKMRVQSAITELLAGLIETEKRFVDANAGNVHVTALAIRPLITHKIQHMLIHPEDQVGPDGKPPTPQERFMKLLVMNAEHLTTVYDKIATTGFLWHTKPHFQLEAFGVLTGMLAQRPTGPIADRGWGTMPKIHNYHQELFDMTQKPIYTQALFTLKAWAAREKAFGAAGQILDTPDYIARLRTLVPTSDSRSSSVAFASPVMQIQQQPQLTELDSFLGGGIDVSSFQWDNSWNTMPMMSPETMTMPDLGDFNMAGLHMKSEMGPF